MIFITYIGKMHFVTVQQQVLASFLHATIFYYIKTRIRDYKTFFMLNSHERKILNAHKNKNIKKFGFFRLR